MRTRLACNYGSNELSLYNLAAQKPESKETNFFLLYAIIASCFKCIWFLCWKEKCLLFVIHSWVRVGGSILSVSFWITTVVSMSERWRARGGRSSHERVVYFSTCFGFGLLSKRLRCLAGEGGGDVCIEVLMHLLESFQKKRQFYQGLSSK